MSKGRRHLLERMMYSTRSCVFESSNIGLIVYSNLTKILSFTFRVQNKEFGALKWNGGELKKNL